MTKQDEINTLKNFVSKLGDGYLSEIFKDIEPMIVSAIQSDFCCIPMREVWAEKETVYQQIKELNKQTRDLVIKKDEVQREILRLTRDLDEVKGEIMRLARTV